MNYRELFKDFYASNPILQIPKNIQLYGFITTIAETSISVNIIKTTWDETHTGLMHPDDLIQHCKDLGFLEWPDLEKFILAIDPTSFNFNYIKQVYNPPFPELGETEMVNVYAVHNHIRATGFQISPFNINVTYDKEYELLSHEDLLKVVKANPSNKYQYIPEKRDCDDFTRIFLGWMSRQGRGNIAIFGLRCVLNYTNGKTEEHLMCLVLTKDKQVYIFEPQNDSYIWKFGDPVKWPGVSSVTPISINE